MDKIENWARKSSDAYQSYNTNTQSPLPQIHAIFKFFQVSPSLHVLNYQNVTSSTFLPKQLAEI